MVTGFKVGMSTVELLTLQILQLQWHPADIAQAAEALRNTRFRSKAQFEKRFFKVMNKKPFEKGDLVLVRNTAIEKELNRKAKPRYNGPFQVCSQTPKGSYKLSEMNNVEMKRGVAAFRLILYITRAQLEILSHHNIEEESEEEEWSDE